MSIILTFIFFRRINEHCSYISTVLIVLLSLYFMIFSNLENKISDDIGSFNEFATFSKQKNILVLLFDSIQSDIFYDIVREKTKLTKELRGFTFFRNNLGDFASTRPAIPAILTGEIYDNSQPIDDFIEMTANNNFIGIELENNNFQVDLNYWAYCRGQRVNCYNIKRLIQSERDLRFNDVAIMIDVTLFRQFPHFVKRFVYNDHLWLVSRAVAKKGLETFQMRDVAFIRGFIKRMNANSPKPTFKFIHMMHTHPPVMINEECQFIGGQRFTRENYKPQVSCALDLFIKILKRLKAQGLYDNTFILLIGDHGARLPVLTETDSRVKKENSPNRRIIGTALPLLLGKPFRNSDEFKISNAPVQLSDIPATICSLLKNCSTNYGKSIFEYKEDSKRIRKYYHFDGGRVYPANMAEYSVDGLSYDPNSWYFSGYKLASASNNEIRRIDFSSPKDRYYLGIGWSEIEKYKEGNIYGVWTMGPVAQILLNLPKKGILILKGQVSTHYNNKNQSFKVKIDGTYVATVEVPRRRTEFSVKIPLENVSSTKSIIEFEFAQWNKPKTKDVRPLAVLFKWIDFELHE